MIAFIDDHRADIEIESTRRALLIARSGHSAINPTTTN